MRICILSVLLLAATPAVAFEVEQHGLLGQYGANPDDPGSALNALGAFGNPYGDTIGDPDSANGIPYGGQSATDPDADDASNVLGGQGDFWNRFSFQAHGPDSASKPYGRFGNSYSSDGDNPYGAGNPYAPNSPTNPYFRNGSIFGGQ